MKFAITAAALALSAGAADAQAQSAAPAPAAVIAPPKAFAGYSQPEITRCSTIGAARRECVVPAGTAGRYLIVARDSATATGKDAAQVILIAVGMRVCAGGQPEPLTDKQTIEAACEVEFLADQPVTIAASYAVRNGVADPAGPQLEISREPWSGVLGTAPVMLRPPAPAAPPKPAGK